MLPRHRMLVPSLLDRVIAEFLHGVYEEWNGKHRSREKIRSGGKLRLGSRLVSGRIAWAVSGAGWHDQMRMSLGDPVVHPRTPAGKAFAQPTPIECKPHRFVQL